MEQQSALQGAKAVVLSQTGAGVGVRAIATVIDTIIMGIVAYFIARWSGGTTAEGFNIQGGPFFLLMLIGLVYYIVMEAVWGATAGKMLTGLRVVRAEAGAAISWSESTIRNVMRIIDGLLVYLVGAIVVWASKRNQRVGDRMAGTLVVRKSR